MITDLLLKIKKLPQTNLGIEHHFSKGIYAKEMHLPKGHIAISHKHTYSHLSILAKGIVVVKTDEYENFYIAPTCIEIKEGILHSIEALEDTTWYCIHATDICDPEKIDEIILEEKPSCHG